MPVIDRSPAHIKPELNVPYSPTIAIKAGKIPPPNTGAIAKVKESRRALFALVVIFEIIESRGGKRQAENAA